MNENTIFDVVKNYFKKQDKDIIIEYLSALFSNLLINDVSVGICNTPDYIEYIDNNGIVRKVQGRSDSISIQEEMILDFSKHDKNVREEFRKEFLKNMPKLSARK